MWQHCPTSASRPLAPRGTQVFGGLSFVLSGFQNDGSSHNMATNFLLSFAFYFLELYVLKP